MYGLGGFHHVVSCSGFLFLKIEIVEYELNDIE